MLFALMGTCYFGKETNGELVSGFELSREFFPGHPSAILQLAYRYHFSAFESSLLWGQIDEHFNVRGQDGSLNVTLLFSVIGNDTDDLVEQVNTPVLALHPDCRVVGTIVACVSKTRSALSHSNTREFTVIVSKHAALLRRTSVRA